MDSGPTGKPWYRVRNVVLAIIAVLAGLFAYQVVRALTAKPGSSVDYARKLEELAAGAQPGNEESPNAWDLFQGAIILRVEATQLVIEAHPEVGARWIDYSMVPHPYDPKGRSADWNLDEERYNQQRDLAIRAIEEMRRNGMFDVLAQAAATDRFVRPLPPGPLTEIDRPERGQMRDLARLCAARMVLGKSQEGQPEVTQAFDQGLAVARFAGSEPTLLGILVGNAIVSYMTESSKDAAMKGELSAVTMRAMLAAMDRQLPLPSLRYAFEGERLYALDVIQRTHTDDGAGDGRRIVQEAKRMYNPSGSRKSLVSESKLTNLASFLYPTKLEISERTTAYFDALNAIAGLPPEERAKCPTDPGEIIASLSWEYDLLERMAPAYWRMLTSMDRSRSDEAGFRLLLAIEVFRKEQGREPATLDELVPAVLSELPRDPYAQDGRFCYRVLAAPDAKGRRYLLYSVWDDGEDDGGVEEVDGEEPLEGAGMDRIINQAQQ